MLDILPYCLYRVFHWVEKLSMKLCCLSSKLLGPPFSAFQCWGNRHTELWQAVYKDDDDLNSSPHACRASILTHWTISVELVFSFILHIQGSKITMLFSSLPLSLNSTWELSIWDLSYSFLNSLVLSFSKQCHLLNLSPILRHLELLLLGGY